MEWVGVRSLKYDADVMRVGAGAVVAYKTHNITSAECRMCVCAATAASVSMSVIKL